MMADGFSSELGITEEADIKHVKSNNTDEFTHLSNGEHKNMERERVKKKAPGKAVIMTGASTHPPTHDIGNAKDYVMQYTDIFASEGNSEYIDEEGGEIVESSDTEIVGHSEENTHYSKDGGGDDSDDDDDHESLEGPPPLDSEDDYEYDDSDLAFSPPPPMGSDGSEGERVQSSVQSSPAKSVSSVEKLTIKEKLARRESPDSDPGYLEGPPPLDSDDENAAVQNGVGSLSDENHVLQNNNGHLDLSDDEEQEQQHEVVHQESDEEEDEEDNLIKENRVERVESPDDNDSISSDDLPEDERRMLVGASPSDEEETIEQDNPPASDEQRLESPEASPSKSPDSEELEPTVETEQREEAEETEVSRVNADSPPLSASPEPFQPVETDSRSDTEESDRVGSPEPLAKHETPEITSDAEAPLLLEKNPSLHIPSLTPKKNKTYLKEKANTVEKSALLMSDSSEDEDAGQMLTQERKLSLTDSEPEANDGLIKPVEPVRKSVSKEADRKQTSQTRTIKSLTSKKEGTTLTDDDKKKTTGKQTPDTKTQNKSKEQKTRETSSRSSRESIEDLSRKSKVAKATPSAKGVEKDAHKRQAPGIVVKDERSKATTKKTAAHPTKHAPGLAVKADTPRTIEKDSKVSKTKDVKLEEKKRNDADYNSSRKTKSETPPKQKTTPPKKDAKHDNATQKKDKASVNNGEVKKVKQRPKIFKSKYVAVATEDDFDDEEDEAPVEEYRPEKTRTEIHSDHREHSKTKQSTHVTRDRHHGKANAHEHLVKGHKHDRSKHVWLCRDDEIHKLIAQKASLLKEYESGSLAGKNVFSGKKSRHRKDEEDASRSLPDVSFAGSSRSKHRATRPVSEIIPEREPYTTRKRENRRSLQHRYSGSSSEDDDERTNKVAGNLRAEKTASGGTFSVGMASRNLPKRDGPSDSDHEETCEYCAAEKASQKAQERDLVWEGPHHPRNLLLGVVYTAKYLGSSQIMSPQSPDRNVRMQQAQEAVGRIKVPEGEDQPTTDVDLFISTERIKVVNSTNKDIMMDHALRTVSFIADIGDVLVLMARRPPGNTENVLETKPSASQILASVAKAETDPKMIKITCHVFQAPEAQVIAKSIGQAFNVAYQEFLRTNGISEDSVEDAEYNCVLEAQKILGEDLTLLSDASKSREIVVNKKPGESLGVMIVESGWGSMIPTAIIAHLAKEGPAAKSGRLNVGDQILAVNNTSLVGLPLPECQTVIKNSRPGTKVVMKVVSCPPTVQVVVNRPDTKYQLGFSVQNGMICSLMRGSIAERGGVRVGHRIIEINGESVVATSHQHIVDLLASTTGEIRMKTMPASMYRLLVGLDTPQYI